MKERYCRNRIYISEDSQERIKQTRLLLGGAGIGSIIAECALRYGFENKPAPPQLASASWLAAGLCVKIMHDIVDYKPVKYFPDFYFLSLV